MQDNVDKPLSLAAKMAAITEEIEWIPKRGKNTFHNYMFATDADIFDTCRKLCGKYRVWVQLDIVPGSEKYEFFGESSGKFRVRTTFLGRVRVNDGDSDTVFESFWPGYSHDSDDKGVNKASTAFAKYAYIRLFHISTGEDPDAGADGDMPKSDGTNQKKERKESPATGSKVKNPQKKELSGDDLERREIVKGIYAMFGLTKESDKKNIADAKEEIAVSLGLAEVPPLWSGFSLPDLRRFVSGETSWRKESSTSQAILSQAILDRSILTPSYDNNPLN